MPIFEVISPNNSEFVEGSTPHQVALAISREREVFEGLVIQNMEDGSETLIDGTTLLSLAYLDNNYGLEDEEWNLE